MIVGDLGVNIVHVLARLDASKVLGYLGRDIITMIAEYCKPCIDDSTCLFLVIGHDCNMGRGVYARMLRVTTDEIPNSERGKLFKLSSTSETFPFTTKTVYLNESLYILTGKCCAMTCQRVCGPMEIQ